LHDVSCVATVGPCILVLVHSFLPACHLFYFTNRAFDPNLARLFRLHHVVCQLHWHPRHWTAQIDDC
jgi:hypothetical protein